MVAIYLPLSRLLSLYVAATQGLFKATQRFLLAENEGKVPYIIGVAGSVAVGKSTTARVLKALLARWPNTPKVDLVTTDGFLLPNAELARLGLMERKGFPESYDTGKLLHFLADIKAGKRNVRAPLYSHLVYDVVPGEETVVDRPDILIVEGLNVLQPARLPKDGTGDPVRLGLLRLLGLSRRRRARPPPLVREPLPAAAPHRVSRPAVLFPQIRRALGRGGDRHRRRALDPHQPREPAREHRADPPAREPDPAQGRRATASSRSRCGGFSRDGFRVGLLTGAAAALHAHGQGGYLLRVLPCGGRTAMRQAGIQ